MSRFGRLPQTRAIQALEALDRAGTAGRVADEMAMTRSGVSHMLRRLEADLGFALTEPDGRGVRLTARGRAYAGEARRALGLLKAAGEALPAVSGDVSLSCPAGLAAFWLADRLGRFCAQHPGVRLKLVAARGLGDMGADSADVMIAFGDETAMPADARLLARVSLFPVCAPSLVSAEAGLRRPADLARFRLLHLGSAVDWQRWLEAAGATTVDPRQGLTVSDTPMLHMTAMAGAGVALGDDLNVRAALAAGQLVRPFALSVPSRWSYFMSLADGPAREAADILAQWVVEELAGPAGD